MNPFENRIIDANTAIILWKKLKQILNTKNIREDNKFNQEYIANRTNLTQATISRNLNGENKKPELATYWRIAEALWISKAEFEVLFTESDMERLWRTNDDIKIATLVKERGMSLSDLEKALNIYDNLPTK